VVLKAYQTLCSRAIGHCANGRSAGKYTKNGRLEIQERVSRECKKKRRLSVTERKMSWPWSHLHRWVAFNSGA
jgi:hypothetical protein